MRPARLLVLTLLALAAAVPAIAADPEKGEVSKAAPKITWKGQTEQGFLTTITAITVGEAPVCQAPSCDTFALTVKDTDKLTVTANGGAFTMLQIVKPDGTKIYNYGAEEEQSTTTVIENAPTGDYEVQVAQNHPATATYNAFAALGAFDAKGKPTGGSAPPPSSTPPPSSQPPAATMTIKTRKASARKVKKKLKVAIETSSPLTEVTVVLRKGSKVLGKASLAKLDKAAKVTVKLRKALRKGKYTLTAQGKDSGGRVVGTSAPLKVSK